MGKHHCDHRSFWTIYKAINFHLHFFNKNGWKYRCGECGEKCILQRKGSKKLKQLSVKSFFTYVLRMLPAAIFIILFVKGVISPRCAIALTIIYHLVAMWCIIKYSKHLKISEK